MTSKAALISGGTRGIGLAIARELARMGFDVATFARTAEEVDTFPGKMEELGVRGLAFQGDARDDAFLGIVVGDALATFGRLDVLVNNAGGGKQDPVLKADIADWDFILDVNLRSPMILTKLCLPELVKTPGSAVINVASMAGKTGIANVSAYCASKFGLVGFTQSLFEEVRDLGVKVCVLCPGYVDTKLIPSRKSLRRGELIRPEDVAKAARYVLECSPSACPGEIIVHSQKNPFSK